MPGMIINFYELSYFDFERLFGEMGWLLFAYLNEASYPRLVRCFYSNMKYEDGGPIKMYVNGVEIKFDVVELCDILDIKNDGIIIFE